MMRSLRNWNRSVLLVAVFSVAGITWPAVGAAQTILPVYPAQWGPPPGPYVKALSDFGQFVDNMVPAHTVARGIHTGQLSGVGQIPLDARIQEVRLMRISSGTFSPGAIPTEVLPFLSNGQQSPVYVQVPTGAFGIPPHTQSLGIYGVDSYGIGGTGTFTLNPYTGQAWQRADLLSLQVGALFRWDNSQGNTAQAAQRLQFNEFTVEVVLQPITITGPTTVWSFNGANPSGWSTSIDLTSSGGASTTWSIVSGSDKVSLSSTTGTQVAVSSAPAGYSATVGDIVIRATAGGTSADHAITDRTPRSLESSAADVTTADATFVYMTRIEYRIRDQFAVVLPSISLPINEQWTTGVINDAPKNNWRRGQAGSFTIPAASNSRFVDGIQGETPNRVPTPILDPASTTPVYHWGQAWQVGSLTIGAGRRVQTNVLQKMIGRALHTSIVSPP